MSNITNKLIKSTLVTNQIPAHYPFTPLSNAKNTITTHYIDENFKNFLHIIVAPHEHYRVVCNSNPNIHTTHRTLREALAKKTANSNNELTQNRKYSIFNDKGLCLA